MSQIPADTETAIYIINKDYRIIHFNESAKNIFPGIQYGRFCYQVLSGKEAPCIDCPFATAKNHNSVFYHKKSGQWLDLSCGTTEWPGEGICHIVLARPIQEESKNLFYSLTNISSYDELFELNPTQDTYRILYHIKDKYVLPPEKGQLTSMLADVSEHMVHPNDKQAFMDFWGIVKASSQTKDSSCDPSGSQQQNLWKGQFRKRLIRGGYCWVLLTVVPLLRSETSDSIIMCFIQDIDDQKQKEENLPYYPFDANITLDPLTGLYKKAVFLHLASDRLKNAVSGQYCLTAIDIEHFKLFNEWYGQEAGDRFLINIGRHLKAAQEQDGGVAGYMGDDDFVILLPNNEAMLDSLQKQIIDYVRQYEGSAGFLPAFGIYVIEDTSLPVNTMYDRSCMALSSVKGNYAHRVHIYDSKMMQKLEKNHILLSEVQRALDNHEFTFYAQPQCDMATGKIIGFESLVRWIHPQKGVIPPGEFIPLLESNGFITNVDMYIWDSVCSHVRKWIDSGHRAIPISVNVSRVDIYTMDVVDIFKKLMDKYRLDPHLIEIEITESAYVEEYDIITNVVQNLKKEGFPVFMDDFGSGFSSLNMLKDVNVDVLKLDMKFLDMNEQSAKKGVSILQSIISMAHLINLRLIAEGVETEEQMNFLLDMDCFYGQGYYFYRPMPIDAFEPLLADEHNIDFRGIRARRLESLHIKNLLDENLLSEAVMNNILGGIAFFDLTHGEVSLVRVNEQYYRTTHTNPVDLAEHGQDFLKDIHHEDHEILMDIFRCAHKDIVNGGEGTVRLFQNDGDVVWLHLHAFFLKEQDNHQLYYGSVSDMTEQKRREQQLEASQRALSAVVHIAGNDPSFMKLAEENRRTAASIFAQMTPGGMIGGYCEEGFPLYFANSEMVLLLGYSTYEEFASAIEGKVINTIHPEDRSRVAKDIGPEYYAGLEYTTSYRMPKKDGSWFWTLDKGKVIRAENGRLAIVSACTDISEPMAVQQKLSERNTLLLSQNRELNFLNHYLPGGYHRCAKTKDFDFLYISPRFLDIFGYTREDILTLFDNKFLNMVHPDDRKYVSEISDYLTGNDLPKNLEYRMLSKNGYIWVVDQSKYLEYNGKGFLQGVIMDVTETIELRDHMKLLMEHIPENIELMHFRGGHITSQVIAHGLFRAMGYSYEEYSHAIQENLYEQEEWHLDMRRQIREGLAASIEHRENYQNIFRIHLHDGNTYWISLFARFIHEDDTGVTYLCIYSDLTYAKQNEQELWLVNRKMESILRQASINSWDWIIPRDLLVLTNEVSNKNLLRSSICFGKKQCIIHNFPDSFLSWIASVPEGRERVEEFLDRVAASSTHESISCELPLPTQDGEPAWIKVACETIRNEDGELAKAVGYYMDITDEKREYIKTHESLKILDIFRSQALYSFRVNLSADTISGQKEKTAWLRETGCPEESSYSEAIHHIGHTLVVPEQLEGFLSFCSRERLIELYEKGILTDSLDYRRRYQGHPHWMRVIVHLVRFENYTDYLAYLFISDIDDQKTQELQLTQMAETDSLTGLYNRHCAMPKCKKYLKQMRDETAALIMFDLDNFKSTNDVYGHSYGDSIISRTAQKLRQLFRGEDICCRIGGDEFLVLCKNISEKDTENKLCRITDELAVSFHNDGKEFHFSISAGYVMIPEHGTEFDELYKKADIALFAAKMGKKGTYLKYESSMKAIRYELVNQRK